MRQKKGLPCGPKLWGPKTEIKLLNRRPEDQRMHPLILSLGRPLSRPDDEIITPLDDLYLQYFCENCNILLWRILSLRGEYIPFAVIPKERSALMISSKATRCAISAFASFTKSGILSTEHTMQYLGRCYKYMREAISSPPSLDLIYACYVIFLLSNRMTESIDTICIHFYGLLEVIKYLQRSSSEIPKWEWRRIEVIQLVSLAVLWGTLLGILLNKPDVFTIRIRKVCCRLDQTFCPTLAMSGNGYEENLLWSLIRLNIYIPYHSAHYLSLLEHVGEESSSILTDEAMIVSETLTRILHEYTETFSRHDIRLLDNIQNVLQFDLDNFSLSSAPSLTLDAALHVFKFLSVVAIKNMLAFPKFNGTKPQVDSTALSLYKMSILFGLLELDKNAQAFIEVPFIFLTALLIPRSHYPEGNYSCHLSLTLEENGRLRDLLARYFESLVSDFRGEVRQAVEALSQLLDRTDQCSSWQEVWTLNLKGKSLWHFFLRICTYPMDGYVCSCEIRL